jgi:hypothetical protein
MLTNQIAELASVVRDQMAEIDRLRADNGRLRTENERLDKLRAENRRLINWIMGEEPDALLALQRVYSDPKTSVPDVIKSANAALPFERGKPAQVVVQVDFRERVRNARLRQLELDKAEWARQDAAKLGLDAEPTILGGPEADPAA